MPWLFVNLATVTANTRMLRRAAAMAPPSEPTKLTDEPGLPVLLRGGFLFPLAVVVFGWWVFASLSSITPAGEAEVGACADWPTEVWFYEHLVVQSCDEPHDIEIFAEATPRPGFRTDQTLLAYCAEQLELYLGFGSSPADFDVSFIGDDGVVNSAFGSENVLCVLSANDGSKIVGSRRGIA